MTEEGLPVSVSLSTAGEPCQIRLTADKSTFLADGQDLIYVTVEILDRNGLMLMVLLALGACMLKCAWPGLRVCPALTALALGMVIERPYTFMVALAMAIVLAAAFDRLLAHFKALLPDATERQILKLI